MKDYYVFRPYSDTKSVDNGMARCTQESQASPRNKWTSHESYAAEDIFETSSITVASVAEGIACIFSGDAQELTVLGVRQQKCVDPGMHGMMLFVCPLTLFLCSSQVFRMI